MTRQWNRGLPLRVVLSGLAVALNGATALSAERLASSAEQRAEKLKAHVERFVIRVTPNLSVVEKPFYSLTARVNAPQKQTGFDWHADLTREQAIRIIEYLAQDRFLASAKEWDLRLNTPSRFKTEGYVISVDGLDENTRLYEELGWNAAMLKRLDGLRKVLDGDAARGMDFLLERMIGLRRQWGVPGQPSASPQKTAVVQPSVGRVVGWAVDYAGEPVADAAICAFPHDHPSRKVLGRAAADGMFSIEVAPCTNLIVEVMTAGNWRGKTFPVTVLAGRETNVGRIAVKEIPGHHPPEDPR
jgi:hypothetical protein